MTGCPNGCARPYQSDIGIVGRSGDKYTLFVGGRMSGHRLNFALKDLVPREQIVPTLADSAWPFRAGPPETANASATTASGWAPRHCRLSSVPRPVAALNSEVRARRLIQHR